MPRDELSFVLGQIELSIEHNKPVKGKPHDTFGLEVPGCHRKSLPALTRLVMELTVFLVPEQQRSGFNIVAKFKRFHPVNRRKSRELELLQRNQRDRAAFLPRHGSQAIRAVLR